MKPTRSRRQQVWPARWERRQVRASTGMKYHRASFLHRASAFRAERRRAETEGHDRAIHSLPRNGMMSCPSHVSGYSRALEIYLSIGSIWQHPSPRLDPVQFPEKILNTSLACCWRSTCTSVAGARKIMFVSHPCSRTFLGNCSPVRISRRRACGL